MFLYSLTGVPLIYGIPKNVSGFGHSSYSEEKYRISELSFNPNQAFNYSQLYYYS